MKPVIRLPVTFLIIPAGKQAGDEEEITVEGYGPSPSIALIHAVCQMADMLDDGDNIHMIHVGRKGEP